MVGMHITNADKLLPDFQTLHVGQELDKGGTMVVQAVEPGSHLVLGPPESVDTVTCTWAFGIYPIDDSATRLVTRVRADWNYRRMLKGMPVYAWPMCLGIELGAFIMERKMLLEIKHRAESGGLKSRFMELWAA
jgi:hypothetical protein